MLKVEAKTKISIGQKVAFGLGGTAEVLMSNAVLALAMPIYNIGLGVSPIMIGFALGFPRLLDAITDPLMGNLSDNTRSRFGRRRPYIAIGAILTGILFAAMWMPPRSLGPKGMFGYFLLISILYFLAYTVFMVPWNAIGYELATDYNERTRVMAYKSFFSSAGAVFILPWAYKLCFLLGDTEVEGVRTVGVIFGAAMILFGVVPAVFCKEDISVQGQQKIRLKEAVKCTMQNKPFMLVTGTVLLMIMGIFLVSPFGTYINIYHVFGGDKEKASQLIVTTGIVYGISGMAFVPVITWLATHYGKRMVLLVGEGFVFMAFFSSWFLFTPAYPYLQLVYFAMVASGFTCVWVLTASMIADVCDIDELSCGLRREGMFGAIFTFAFKLGYSGVMVLAGYMLAFSGFDVNLGADQTPQTILNMRLFYMFAPAICIGLAFLCTFKYSISEKRMHEVRSLLDERKNQATD